MIKIIDPKVKTDQRKRSIIKALTFRVVVLLSDSIVVSSFTNKEGEVLNIVLFTNILSTLLYYLHERIWNKIQLLKNNDKKHNERVTRSLIKSVTFRIIVLISDFIVTSLITRNFAESLSIIVLTNLSSTFLYFIHERIWNRISLWKY
ncbi:MAG: DUF2061 domain-containing protein [Candidatus Dojkabacteria bacterium]